MLRGQLLFHQGRYALAEAEFRRAVLADPGGSAGARAFLALTLLLLGRTAEGEAEAKLAVGADPSVEFGHFALAVAARSRGRLREAEGHARECLRLDPEYAPALNFLASAALARDDWPAALDFAGAALRLDPTDEGAANTRTAALLQLGRVGEAAEHAADSLRLNPDSDTAHADRGWVALHTGDAAAALTHFREALRLDATNEAARFGLLQALKARYRVYRVGLRVLLWFGRRGVAERVGIVGVAILAQRGLGAFGRANPGLEWLTLVAILAIAAAFLLIQINGPLSNLFLRLNRFGRQVLTPDERRGSTVVGLALLAALVCVGLNLTAGLGWSHVAGVMAVGFALLTLPLAQLFELPPGKPRWLMAAYTAAMGCVLAAVFGYFAAALDADTLRAARPLIAAAYNLIDVYVLLTIGSGFAAVGFRRLG